MRLVPIIVFFLFISAEADIFSLKVRTTFSLNFSSAELIIFVFIMTMFLFIIKKQNLIVFFQKYKIYIILTALFLLSAFLSTLFSSVNKIYAFKYFIRYFVFLLTPWLLFYLLTTHVDFKNNFFHMIFYLSAFLSLISIIEFYNPEFAKILANTFRDGQSVYINGKLRPAVTLPHSNIFACFTGIAIISGLKLFFEKKINKTYFYLFLIPMLISISLSSSRNAMFSFLISILILFFNKNYFKTVFIVIVLFIISYFVFSPSVKRIAEIKTESSIARINLWKAAVKIFINYPLLGVGPGCYNKILINFSDDKLLVSENQFIKNGALNAHNAFFNILSEFGILGTLIALLFFAFYLKNFFSFYKLNPVSVNHSLLLIITLPFITDAFFYSYFFMILFFTILLSFLQE